MTEPSFFAAPKPVSLQEIAAWTGARIVGDAGVTVMVSNIVPLDEAGPGDLAFLDNRKYLPQLEATRASACLVAPAITARVPAGVIALEVADPYRAFATVLGKMYPDALRLVGSFGAPGLISTAASIHGEARLEPGVTVEPGAVIGARAEIGTGTVIGANAVIGHDVRIGRNCYVGPTATLIHALVGNRVVIHPGVRVGQDGFGFAMGGRGHQKVPQIGRVVIQDDVEIGANTTIDRGTTRDTVIGEGSKIDNLVQIGHNVAIGRHCVIVGQVGISGSTVLEDFVVLGGQVGIAGHVRIGAGTQVAAKSGIMSDVPGGLKVGGAPARPMREWMRELAAIRRLATRGDRTEGGGQ